MLIRTEWERQEEEEDEEKEEKEVDMRSHSEAAVDKENLLASSSLDALLFFFCLQCSWEQPSHPSSIVSASDEDEEK